MSEIDKHVRDLGNKLRIAFVCPDSFLLKSIILNNFRFTHPVAGNEFAAVSIEPLTFTLKEFKEMYLGFSGYTRFDAIISIDEDIMKYLNTKFIENDNCIKHTNYIEDNNSGNIGVAATEKLFLKQNNIVSELQSIFATVTEDELRKWTHVHGDMICENIVHDDKKIIYKPSLNLLITMAMQSMLNSMLRTNHVSKLTKILKTTTVDQLNKYPSLYDVVNKSIITSDNKHGNIFISIVSNAFKSGKRIERPWNSLLAQKHTNWEWIVVDDNFHSKKSDSTIKKTIYSKTGQKKELKKKEASEKSKQYTNDDFFYELQKLTNGDRRVRYIRADWNHNGYIGDTKRTGFSLARGEWIVELDHDDDLHEEMLTWLAKIIASVDDSVGFIYSDCMEIQETTYEPPVIYGTTFACGTGSHYMRIFPQYKNEKYPNGSVQSVSKSPPMNPLALLYITGAPNHIRIWRKSIYELVGGHNYNLPVADDYDLILRTFLACKFVRICHPVYYQYRNEQANNFTSVRNFMIQYLVPKIEQLYRESISNRFAQLSQANKIKKTMFVGEQYQIDIDPHDNDPLNPLISVIIPTYNRPGQLWLAIESVLKQTYKRYVIYVIIDCCEITNNVMPAFAEMAIRDYGCPPDNFRWCNLDHNYGAGGAVPRNYALERLISTKWSAYLDDDNIWLPEHLQAAVDSINESKRKLGWAPKFVVSDFYVNTINSVPIRCADPPARYTIDTSCVLHKTNLIYKYGLWKSRAEAGYAHDWELFSRWVNAGEKYVLTRKPTLLYTADENNANIIYQHQNVINQVF